MCEKEAFIIFLTGISGKHMKQEHEIIGELYRQGITSIRNIKMRTRFYSKFIKKDKKRKINNSEGEKEAYSNELLVYVYL